MLNYAPRSSRNLRHDAIPTLHLPRQNHFDEKRSQRITKRRNKREINELLESRKTTCQALPISPSTSTAPASENDETLNIMEVDEPVSCTASSNQGKR